MNDTIGRTRTQSDILDLARASAMHATMGLPGPTPLAGDPLPPFWHYIYFWDAQPPENLGRDGHPAVGGFLPETGLPRRMWAGGSLEFLDPARLGDAAEKISTIDAVAPKHGRSGRLCVVTVTHELRQGGRVTMRERQDLVYREDPDPDAPAVVPEQARRDEQKSQRLSFNPTLLFGYSALTFNGHRIHYDRDYCRGVEGYPGLVVHGPLLAQKLIDMAAAELGRLSRFRFRATAPLFDFEAAECCLRQENDGLALWVRGPDGRLCMEATAS